MIIKYLLSLGVTEKTQIGSFHGYANGFKDGLNIDRYGGKLYGKRLGIDTRI